MSGGPRTELTRLGCVLVCQCLGWTGRRWLMPNGTVTGGGSAGASRPQNRLQIDKETGGRKSQRLSVGSYLVGAIRPYKPDPSYSEDTAARSRAAGEHGAVCDDLLRAHATGGGGIHSQRSLRLRDLIRTCFCEPLTACAPGGTAAPASSPQSPATSSGSACGPLHPAKEAAATAKAIAAAAAARRGDMAARGARVSGSPCGPRAQARRSGPRAAPSRGGQVLRGWSEGRRVAGGPPCWHAYRMWLRVCA